MDAFTSSYREYGLHVQPDNSIHGLEWCPAAEKLALVGDFSEIFQFSRKSIILPVIKMLNNSKIFGKS